MGVSVRIQTGGTEPIQVQEQNQITGITDIFVRVRRNSDGFFLDFAGAPPDTFRAAPTQPNSAALSEVSATLMPGLYDLSGGLDLSLITNTVADDTLTVFPIQTPGTNASLPQPGEIKVGQFVDDLLENTSAIDFRIEIPPLERPPGGSVGYRILLEVRNAGGALIDPDSNSITVTARNELDADRSTNLSAVTRTAVGRYEVTYAVDDVHAIEQILFTFVFAVAAVAQIFEQVETVIDATTGEPPLKGKGF